MANLIPPDAKKEIRTEYWIRVVVLWLVLVGIALSVTIVFIVPTLVLVQSQLSAYSGAYGVAKEKSDAFNDAQTIITDSNVLAEMLLSEASTTPFSKVISTLDTIGGNPITISNYRLIKTDTAITGITITGIASTRSALANFSRDIEAHELFLDAELPISNLAKDRDIAFNIVITPQVQ